MADNERTRTIKEAIRTLRKCFLNPRSQFPAYNKAVEDCIAAVSGISSVTEDTVNSIVNNKNYHHHMNKKCYVYYIYNEEANVVKIGVSVDPKRRLRELRNASSSNLKIVHLIEFESTEAAYEAEKILHHIFDGNRRRPTPSSRPTEWFDAEIINQLKQKFSTAEDIFGGSNSYAEAKKKYYAYSVSLRKRGA